MGNNICGIIVNALPDFNGQEEFDKKKLKTKFTRTKIKSLSPKDLSVGFKDKNTLIFLDLIFYQNISEEQVLTDLEKDIAAIFPHARFLILVINDTVGFTGYSLVDEGIKLRTKAVVNGDIFLDYGDLNSKEMELYDFTQEILMVYPDTLKKMEGNITALNDAAKKKYFLLYRDLLLKKMNKENKLHYRDGSLDNHIIENEFHGILNCDYYDIETLDFIEFERRKLNFKKDSLKEYLFMAKRELS